MKRFLLVVCSALLITSCASSLEKAQRLSSNGSPQERYVRNDPCRDSLFLALKNKPFDSLTAFEHYYFEMKFNDCYNTPVINQSGPAEWFIAVPAIIGIVLLAISIVRSL